MQKDEEIKLNEQEEKKVKVPTTGINEIVFTKNQDIDFYGPKNPLILKDGQTLPNGVTPTHAYVFKDGQICTSVTQILTNQGYAENYEYLTPEVQVMAEESAAFGTMIHKIAERYWAQCKEENKQYMYFKKNSPTLDKIIKEELGNKYGQVYEEHNKSGNTVNIKDENGKPMTWEEVTKDHASFLLEQVSGFKFKEVYPEKHLAFREPLAAAGTCDLIGIRQDGSVCVIDYKTGKHHAIKEKMQLNFYAHMLEKNTVNEKGEGIVAAGLYSINSEEQKIYSYKSISAKSIEKILNAESIGVKLPEVIGEPTEKGATCYDMDLEEYTEKFRAIFLEEAMFYANHPNFKKEQKDFEKIDKKIKTIKDDFKDKINNDHPEWFNIIREDFKSILSDTSTLVVDEEKLKELHPKIYKECLTVKNQQRLTVTPSEDFLDREAQKIIQARKSEEEGKGITRGQQF